MSEDNDNKTAFKKWYAKNKQALAEKRRQRYRTDPAYRAKALENRKRQIERTVKVRDLLPEQYRYNLASLAEHLEVSIWRLREWRGKGFFPEPFKHGRELWFTESQASLIKKLSAFFDASGARVSAEDDKLQELIGFIAVNW